MDRDREAEREDRIANDIINDFEAEFHEGLKESKRVDIYNTEHLENQKRRDLETLKQAWINEKMVPIILPYEEELMKRMFERIRKQLEFIEMNNVELQTQEKDIKLILVLIESELERIQFMIRSYVRLRLRKIDKYALFIQEHEEEKDKLNNDEITYMEGHLSMQHDLFEEQFLKKMNLTRRCNLGEDKEMVVIPDKSFPVITSAIRDTYVSNESINEGSVYVAQWQEVSQGIAAGDLKIL